MLSNQKLVKANALKRALDLLIIFVTLPITLPVFVLLAIGTGLTSGWPILFAQERVGLNNRIFSVYKFRSMTDKRDPNGSLLPDNERLTNFGKILRLTSLDEIPQLWNVAKGDMSFIGPRPLFVRYLPYYTSRESARHSVRPGISGLAQVSGRNNLSWDERLELDVEYVENISLVEDLNIWWKTIIKVFKRDGVVLIPGLEQPPLDVARGVPYSGEKEEMGV